MTADELVSALQRRVENLERDLLTLEMRFMTTSPSSSPDPTSGFDIQRSQFLNTFGIFVADLVLTNNSPSAGNVAWSPCRVIYQGNTFEIPAGNTTSGHAYITWTVNTLNFSESAGYTPGPNIFAIATNSNGVSDVVWPKMGSILTQALLAPTLVYDGPNGSLIVIGVTFSDNTPVAGSVQWSACLVAYQGTTYAIPSGSSDSAHPAIVWKLSSPNQFQALSGQILGADDFYLGNNAPSGSPSSSGFFNRVTRYGDRTLAYTSISETGITGFNKNQNPTFSAQRQAADGTVGAAGNIIVFDGTGSGSQVQVGMTGNIANGGGAVGGMVYTRPCTFAQLPTNAIQGDQAVITDGFAAIPTFSNTATGGGTTIVTVYFDGAQWRYG